MSDVDREECIQQLCGQGERLRALVEDLLDLSRMQEGRLDFQASAG
jgi:signal transduction histidine kinase